MAFHKRILQSLEIQTDQLCCPHCGTKLRWALVSAELGSTQLASSPETSRIDPSAGAETIGAAIESGGDSQLLLEAIEKRTILAAMQKAGGDKILAARMLGIGKTTIYRKLKEYGLDARSTLVSADTTSSEVPKIIPKVPIETLEAISTTGETTTQHDLLEAAQKTMILNAMQEAENDRQLVAQTLGISRTTLFRRLKEYGFPLSRCHRSKAARQI